MLQYRWAMWKINDAGTEIVITAVGPKDAAYEQFVASLPPNDCRFAGALHTSHRTTDPDMAS